MQLLLDKGRGDAQLAREAGEHCLTLVMPVRLSASHRSWASLGVRPLLDVGAGRPSCEGDGVVAHGMCLRPDVTLAWSHPCRR